MPLLTSNVSIQGVEVNKLILIFLASLLVVITGCDTLNHRQYLLISQTTPEQTYIVRQNLKNSLAPVIEKHGLVNSIDDAKREGVLLYYKTKNGFPIQMGAKSTSKGVVVDLLHFHPGTGETKVYTEIVNDVVEVLKSLEAVMYIELKHRSQIN